MKNYETLSKAINGLRKHGYDQDFNLHPEWLECETTGHCFAPAEFHVDEVHRFEGMTSPDDSSVLYAVSTSGGIKGLLVDAYGVYSNTLSSSMIAQLRIDNQTQR